MLNLDFLRSLYPLGVPINNENDKFVLAMYIHLMVLSFLHNSIYDNKIVLIGGSNLRIIHGIDRFTEDLDFNCKELSELDFVMMTDYLINAFRANNFDVVPQNKPICKHYAFQRFLLFPNLLNKVGLTQVENSSFLLKIEAQDQNFFYQSKDLSVHDAGFDFSVQVPPKNILCAMKFSSLLDRQKGTDFYDILFLLSDTKPDMSFLCFRSDIHSYEELKTVLHERLKAIDLNAKREYVERFLFDKSKSKHFLFFYSSFASS